MLNHDFYPCIPVVCTRHSPTVYATTRKTYLHAVSSTCKRHSQYYTMRIQWSICDTCCYMIQSSGMTYLWPHVIAICQKIWCA